MLISLLMHAILTNRGYRLLGRHYGLVYEDFFRIGGLAFEQLAQLRHRGAFSTVSQTFAACCARCLEADDQSIKDLPKRWYQVYYIISRKDRWVTKHVRKPYPVFRRKLPP